MILKGGLGKCRTLIDEVVMITQGLEQAATIREEIPAEKGLINKNSIGTCT